MGASGIADSCQRCGTYQAGEIVSSPASIVNEKDVHFTRSVHANGVRHFDISRSRRTCNDNCRSGSAHTGQSQRIRKRGRIRDACNTAMWISGRSDACSGYPSPSTITTDPVSASPQTAFVTPTRIAAFGVWLMVIPAFCKTDSFKVFGSP